MYKLKRTIFLTDDGTKADLDWINKVCMVNLKNGAFSNDILWSGYSTSDFKNYNKLDCVIAVNDETTVKDFKCSERVSGLKGINKIKLLFRDLKEEINGEVKLTKEINLQKEEHDCFKFSVDNSELEFGKSYLIEVQNEKEESVGRFVLELDCVKSLPNEKIQEFEKKNKKE